MTLGGWSSFWNTVQHLEDAMDRRTAPRWRTGYGQGVIIVGLGLAFRSGCNLSLAHFWPAAYDSRSPLGMAGGISLPLAAAKNASDCYQGGQGKPGSSLGLRPRRILGKQSYLEVLEKRKLKRKKNYYYHGGSKAIGLSSTIWVVF